MPLLVLASPTCLTGLPILCAGGIGSLCALADSIDGYLSKDKRKKAQQEKESRESHIKAPLCYDSSASTTASEASDCGDADELLSLCESDWSSPCLSSMEVDDETYSTTEVMTYPVDLTEVMTYPVDLTEVMTDTEDIEVASAATCAETSAQDKKLVSMRQQLINQQAELIRGLQDFILEVEAEIHQKNVEAAEA